MRSEQIYTSNMQHMGKIFVSKEGLATITCPDCSITKQVPVKKLQGKKNTLKIHCTCGTLFPVFLEFRKNYRRETELDGNYQITSPHGSRGPLSIKNISKNGVGFEVVGSHSIQAGQKATVIFTLDNRKSSRITKEVIVKSVKANYVSCEFIENQPFEKDLGFYLQP